MQHLLAVVLTAYCAAFHELWFFCKILDWSKEKIKTGRSAAWLLLWTRPGTKHVSHTTAVVLRWANTVCILRMTGRQHCVAERSSSETAVQCLVLSADWKLMSALPCNPQGRALPAIPVTCATVHPVFFVVFFLQKIVLPTFFLRHTSTSEFFLSFGVLLQDMHATLNTEIKKMNAVPSSSMKKTTEERERKHVEEKLGERLQQRHSHAYISILNLKKRQL